MNENAGTESMEVATVTVMEPMVVSAALEKAAIDQAISTAKTYPRNVARCKDEAIAIATMDDETAAECFYAFKRGGKIIEGPSVRCAEIVASAWGNLKYGSQVLGHDDEHVIGRGICYDLEKNVMCTIETKRRITDHYGKTYSDDMIAVTGNAAAAIARRQAVFGTIPKAIVKAVYQRAKEITTGDASTMIERWGKTLTSFSKFGVSEKELLEYLDKKSAEEVTPSDLALLTGLRTAIKDKDTTLDEAFGKKATQAPQRTKGKSKKPGQKQKGADKTSAPVSGKEDNSEIIKQITEIRQFKKLTFANACDSLNLDPEKNLEEHDSKTLEALLGLLKK